MRTKFPLHVSLVVLAILAIGAPPALASDEVVLRGGGWGHGVGMPQHGARAMADAGSTAEQIIQHFYTGVQIGTVGQGNVKGHADPLWIGVAPSSTRQRFKVNGDVELCLDGDCLTAKDGQTWRINATGDGECRYEWRKDGAWDPQLEGPCDGEMTWDNQPDTRVEFPDIPNTGRTYARGKIVFKGVPGNPDRFHLVVVVGLEEYLYGLAEMPSSWNMRALRAQAIAGRTYATWRGWQFRNLLSGSESHNVNRRSQCYCHLLATTGDQVYTGWAKESETSGGTHWGARWVEAVSTTKDKVATHPWHNDRAIEAYYFSSSGGATENSEDIGWSHRPYLRSVGDPGATVWTTQQEGRFSRAEFASKLGFSTVFNAKIVSTFPSGSPSAVEVTGTLDGSLKTATFTGTQLRSLLGLRSHYITQILITEQTVSDIEEVLTGDFNGDGRSDVAVFTSSGEWWVGVSTGSGLSFERWAAWSASSGWDTHLVGDFTGNGRDDIASYRPSTGNWTVNRSTGSSFTPATWARWSARTGWSDHLVGDFTGNGRDDIASYRASTGSWTVNRSTGSRFNPSTWATWSARTGWSDHLVGDFTGNGRDDVASYRPSTGNWTVNRSTGSSFTPATWARWSANSGWSAHLVGDFTGNGRDDVASYRPSTGNWTVNRSTGSSFTPATWVTWSARSGWTDHLVGDFTGNGRDDVVSYRPSTGSWTVNRSTGSSFTPSTWATFGIQ